MDKKRARNQKIIGYVDKSRLKELIEEAGGKTLYSFSSGERLIEPETKDYDYFIIEKSDKGFYAFYTCNEQYVNRFVTRKKNCVRNTKIKKLKHVLKTEIDLIQRTLTNVLFKDSRMETLVNVLTINLEIEGNIKHCGKLALSNGIKYTFKKCYNQSLDKTIKSVFMQITGQEFSPRTLTRAMIEEDWKGVFTENYLNTLKGKFGTEEDIEELKRYLKI